MFDHLLPFIDRDCELFDESNKENFGYIVRRRVITDLRVDTRSLHAGTSTALSPSNSASARRRSLCCISPVGASKVARSKKHGGGERSSRNGKKQPKKARDGDKTAIVAKSIGKKRKPLEDITHLYLSERLQMPATRASSHLSTSVAMRFF